MPLPIHYLALHDVLPDIGVFGGTVVVLVVIGLVMIPVHLYRSRRRADGSRSSPRLPIPMILLIAGIGAVIVMRMTIYDYGIVDRPALVVIWAIYTVVLTAIGAVIWRVAKLPIRR